MLVLTRKETEEVLIGDNIRVIVSRITKNKNTLSVRLAIDAPSDVVILRKEVHERNLDKAIDNNE